ncbi:hypothetical protein [Rickettsia endosymbiont of Seladonia tumulorum]|uniref:hypothetical protein n=1 Tax=Rickettsia endosymbiont of Seladonia tumulorum TaxID=3066270 RepID=UPI00313E0774
MIKVAKTLKNEGVVLQEKNYTYLKTSNDFIHKLYPLIAEHEDLQKPDYFSEQCDIGTHITIIYPNEEVVINDQDINVIHSFEIEELAKTQTGNKQYYVLKVSSPSLISLRKKYQLPPQLSFKGYKVSLHITIATKK